MSEARADMSSPIKLAPETIKIRDALIEKFSDKPIEDLNIFIDDALIVEKDEFKRLGLLAARVHILRQRVLTLKAFNRDDTMDKIPSVQLTPPGDQFLDPNISIEDDHHEENDNITEWQTLKMIEPGEVNGVRFFKGTIIDASAQDADRLISSGKAIVVDNDGNPADTNDTTTDEMTETEVTETEVMETEVMETEVMETGVTEDGVTETEVTETEVMETEVMETEVMETGVTENEMTADDNLSVNNEETNK
ncbi:hypothetical protein OAM32_00805 [Alphaproteobacteria bacterium]|nr:hypothetical protein [Alphaproteobacteria bacterium]